MIHFIRSYLDNGGKLLGALAALAGLAIGLSTFQSPSNAPSDNRDSSEFKAIYLNVYSALSGNLAHAPTKNEQLALQQASFQASQELYFWEKLGKRLLISHSPFAVKQTVLQEPHIQSHLAAKSLTHQEKSDISTYLSSKASRQLLQNALIDTQPNILSENSLFSSMLKTPRKLSWAKIRKKELLAKHTPAISDASIKAYYDQSIPTPPPKIHFTFTAKDLPTPSTQTLQTILNGSHGEIKSQLYTFEIADTTTNLPAQRKTHPENALPIAELAHIEVGTSIQDPAAPTKTYKLVDRSSGKRCSQVNDCPHTLRQLWRHNNLADQIAESKNAIHSQTLLNPSDLSTPASILQMPSPKDGAHSPQSLVRILSQLQSQHTLPVQKVTLLHDQSRLYLVKVNATTEIKKPSLQSLENSIKETLGKSSRINYVRHQADKIISLPSFSIQTLTKRYHSTSESSREVFPFAPVAADIPEPLQHKLKEILSPEKELKKVVFYAEEDEHILFAELSSPSQATSSSLQTPNHPDTAPLKTRTLHHAETHQLLQAGF